MNTPSLSWIKGYTMVDMFHLKELTQMVEAVSHVPGALVECGVWKGGCSMAMAVEEMRIAKKMDRPVREIYLYDTFDGMTPPGENDPEKATELFEQISTGEYHRSYDEWHNENKWAWCPREAVEQNLAMTGYPKDQLVFVQGDVVKMLDYIAPEKIAILRLDTDWYESTKKELEVLWPRVSHRGYIIVDDYFSWAGSKKATDEFLAEHKEEFEIVNAAVRRGVLPVLILRKVVP